jgi:hypothetical protein
VRERLESEYYQAGAKQFDITDTAPLTLDLSFLNDSQDAPKGNPSGTQQPQRQPAGNQNAGRKEDDAPARNPFLD